MRLHAPDTRRERRDLVVDILLDAGKLLVLRGEIFVPAREREFAERTLGAPVAAGQPRAHDERERCETGGCVREQAFEGHNDRARPIRASGIRRTMPKNSLKLKYFHDASVARQGGSA